MWYVAPDGYPNQMWTIRNQITGATLQTPSAPGFYRTRSLAKADRDAAKLNKTSLLWGFLHWYRVAEMKARLDRAEVK